MGCINWVLVLTKLRKKIQRDKKTIRILLQRYITTQDVSRKPGSGRPRKIDVRGDHRIVREATNDRFISAPQIASNLLMHVSGSTISRRLCAAGFNGYWSVKKPYISETNQVKRVTWCQQHVNWTPGQWKQVLWSDESPFMFRYNGRKRVWRERGERYSTQCYARHSEP